MRHDSIACGIKGDGDAFKKGDRDAFTPPPLSDSLAAAVPGATIEIMEGCGYVMFHERPAEFNQRAISSLVGSAGDGYRLRPAALPFHERESVG